ncbi:amidohydrolase family protein [Oleiphilus messinensis]|nr:amidohydrolase family protein [Oleiphilus messinensis]
MQADILISDVAVFDGIAAHPLLTHRDVLLKDGRIAAIRDHDPEHSADVKIEGRGMTLMPGLIDFHVHVGGTEAPPWQPVFYTPEYTLSAFLAMGVTSVVDLGGIPQLLEKLNGELATGEITGPRLFYAGRQITAEQSHPGPLIDESLAWPMNSLIKALMVDEVNDESDMDVLIQDRLESGSTLVKIMVDSIPLDSPMLSAESAKRIVAAAHRQHLPVAAHIGSDANLRTALNAGVDVIAHSVNQSELQAETLAELARSETPVVSTLRVFDNIAAVKKGLNPVTAHDARVMDQMIVESFTAPEAITSAMAEYADHIANNRNQSYRGCERMRRAGVPVLMGTDSPLFGAPAGSSAYFELKLLVTQCGYTPAEALQAATSLPGQVLSDWTGQAHLGKVLVDAPADLLLIKGMPSENIDALQQIQTVISRGAVVTRNLPDLSMY